MSSPYINTKLSAQIALKPEQMNNEIYINLKNNLKKKLLGKCYKNYGFIVNINRIDYSEGIIEAENFSASAKYNVNFECRLCRPLIGKQIICQIDQLNKILATAKNGPIKVIITRDKVNKEIFFSDNNNSLRYKKDEESVLLKSGDFVLINIISIQARHLDSTIKGMGFLTDIATDEQIEEYYKDQHIKDEKIIDFDEYINN